MPSNCVIKIVAPFFIDDYFIFILCAVARIAALEARALHSIRPLRRRRDFRFSSLCHGINVYGNHDVSHPFFFLSLSSLQRQHFARNPINDDRNTF